MKSFKKFQENFNLLGFSTLFTKLVSLVQVALVSNYLSTFDFGKIDLILTILILIIPIFSLDIADGVLRFTIKEKNEIDKVAVLLIGFKVIIVITLIISLGILFLIIFYEISQLLLIAMGLFIAELFFMVIYQFLKGSNFVKEASLSQAAVSLLNVFFVICFIMVARFDVETYFLSMFMSYISIDLILLFFLLRKFHLKSIPRKSLFSTMINYSIPLIPNNILWWIIEVSDRYLVTFFLGLSANGILAFANKIPSIVTSIGSVFNQSYQITAIENIDGSDKNALFTQSFNSMTLLFGILLCVIALCLKIVYKIFVNVNYYESIYLVPILLLSVYFSVVSGFLGTVYTAKGFTKKLTATSLLSASINIFINLIFMEKYGIIVAGSSTLVSYLVIAIYRFLDVKKYISININRKNIIFIILFVCICINVIFVQNIIVNCIINFIFFVLLIFLFLFCVKVRGD